MRGKAGALLSKLFPKGARLVTIRGGVLQGCKIFAELRRGEKAYWLGMFELDLQLAIQALAEDSPRLSCIYDVGAHIGFFSMVLARCFQQAQVFAFEPNPRNYERLALNVGRNELAARITLVDRALSDESQRTQFHIGESTWSGSLIRDHRDNYNADFSIVTATLDELVFRDHYPPPELIKIDVEGAEVQVLRGGTKVLQCYKPTLIIEVHYVETGEQVVSLLRQIGYDIRSLDDDETKLVDTHLLARYKSS
jgi:FkbM family methyltransferase